MVSDFLFFFKEKVAKRQRFIKNIKIEKIAYGGVGISQREDGKKIIIKGGALPGTLVDCKVIKNKKDHIEAHISEVHSYDNKIKLQNAFCSHFFSPIQGEAPSLSKHKIGCGGCKWQILPYLNQLELKQKIVEESLSKLEKKGQLQYIIGSPEEKFYRNKIEFSFGPYISFKESVDERKNLGFHKQGEFSKIVDIDKCYLVSEKMHKAFEYIKNLCFQSGLTFYDNIGHKGFFRHLVIREGKNTDQLLINLSIADGNLDTKGQETRTKLKKDLLSDKQLLKLVNTFVITYNNGLADTVKGNDIYTETLFGDGYIYEKLVFEQEDILLSANNEKTEISFRVSPFSFFQTNTLGAQQLFKTAFDMIGKIKGNILDLYCGAGTIGLSFKKLGLGEKLVGVEIVEEAIIDANHNSKINGLDGESNFFALPSEKFATDENNAEYLNNIGLIIVDPPRDGLHKNVIKFIADLKKENKFKLLYISCNPITMVRDIALFQEYGFKLGEIQPVDMFPQTHHIEVIGILS